ncbi:MAG: glycosyltransferase family 4 protein [Acidimicrobiia bacterium]
MEEGQARYVLLINSLAPGGAERSLVELLPPLAAGGISPVLVCLDRSDIGFEQEVADGGFDLRFVSASRLVGRVREVRSILHAEEPRLLHTTLFDSDIVGRLAAWGTGVPVLTTLANTTYEPARIAGDANLTRSKVNLVKRIDAFTARRLTDHFHAVSAAVKESAVHHLGIDPDKVTVVRRGRDPVRLGRRTEERRRLAREQLGVGSDARLVLTVGRHEYQKGQAYLIEAFAAFSGRQPSAVLLVAGREGNASESLQRKAEEGGIADRVRFLGHRADVGDLMAAADVFVFPSLWEGLGGVLIEALALEVPIVSSDLAATREVVGGDGSSGILVAPGDVDALASAIEGLLDDPEQRQRAVGNSRKRFETEFLLADRSEDLIELMSTVAR